MIDRYSPEASLCGSLLIDGACLPEVRGKCSAEDISDDNLRKLFETACTIADEGSTLDSTTIQQRSGVDSRYCCELMDITPTAANAGVYADLVRKNAALSRMVELCDELSVDAALPGADPVQVAADYALRLTETAGLTTSRVIENTNALMDFCHHRTAVDKGEERILKSGFPSLDSILGGFAGGGLYVVGARPSIGKSAFGLVLADAFVRQGKRVLFVTLEMTARELTARRVSALSGIGYGRLLYGEMDQGQYDSFVAAVEKLTSLPLPILEAGGYTMSQIAMEVRNARPEVLVVDYLGLIRGEDKHQSEYERVTETSLALKQLATNMHIPVIALCQLNREAPGMSDHRPRLNHLRSSGAIEQDADAVMLLHRPDYYADPDRRTKGTERQPFEVMVAKNRHGATGTALLQWYAVCNRFLDEQAEGRDLRAVKSWE